MYKVVFTRRALKDWEGIDREAKKRIVEKLKIYSEDPFRYARRLVNPEIGSYRFRIGDYRVIFDVDGDKIVVLRVGHRKDIYR